MFLLIVFNFLLISIVVLNGLKPRSFQYAVFSRQNSKLEKQLVPD